MRAAVAKSVGKKGLKVAAVSSAAAKKLTVEVAKAVTAELEVPKKVRQAGEPWEGWEVGSYVGRKVRTFVERHISFFGVLAKVVGQQGEYLQLDVEGKFHSVQVHCKEVEDQSSDLPPLKVMPLQLRKEEMLELKLTYPDMETLELHERMAGVHVQLGHWITCRDLGVSIYGGGCELVPPWCVQALLDAEGEDAEEVRRKATQVLLRRYRRGGLTGIPIWCQGDGPGHEHWTLLCLRKFHQKLTQVSYYDSARNLREDCLARAVQLLQLVQGEFPGDFDKALLEHQIPVKVNTKSFQSNSVDCGVFLLHFWEGELRRFFGHGWGLEFPQTGGNIKSRKVRLSACVRKVRDAQQKPEPVEVKHKPGAAQLGKISPILEEVAASQALAKQELQKLAASYAAQGSVPFYGCSRCRMSRGGCISWNCNPDKYQAHRSKFPEKYEDGKLLDSAAQEMSWAELECGK